MYSLFGRIVLEDGKFNFRRLAVLVVRLEFLFQKNRKSVGRWEGRSEEGLSCSGRLAPEDEEEAKRIRPEKSLIVQSVQERRLQL